MKGMSGTDEDLGTGYRVDSQRDAMKEGGRGIQ